MDNIKSEHMSSENSTPIKKNSLKSPKASDSQRGTNQQNQQQQPKQRRSRSDNHNREFQCGCGKSYLSGAALYTHVKQKHGGVAQSGQQQPSVSVVSTKSKSKKSDSNGQKSSVKQEETQQVEKQFDASTVYDDIINFFTKNMENHSNQKLENNEGYDWILEIFPRHYFTKGTDYFKILKNLENFIKITNYYNNQMNHTYASQKTSNANNSQQLQANKSDTQLNGKKQTGEDNFGEENTYENDNDNESVGGSPNNLKKINKKLSGSTVHNAARNSTATASFDDRNLDGQDNHHYASVNENNIDNIEKDHHQDEEDNHNNLLQNHPEYEDSTIDIYDISKDLRITSLNKIFSIFILNISQRVSQPILIEILVFITLLRKALNEKGWENCSSPLPYEQLRHYMRTPYGYLLPLPGHHANLHHASAMQQQQNGDNINQVNLASQQLKKKKKNNLRKRKQTDNMTTAESSAALQSKKGSNNDEGNNDKNTVLQEEEEVEEEEDEIQEDEEEVEDDDEEEDAEENQQSAKKDSSRRDAHMVKVENTSEEKQHNNLFQSQYEFCEVNSAQFISEISNTFIVECLPEYFKTAISNANELHVIGPSEEGLKNACFVLKLIINWMYAFKFSESKLVFQDSADEETELKQDSCLEEEADIQTNAIGTKETDNENKRKRHANQRDVESSHHIENDFNHGDVSHDNLEGRNSNRYKNHQNSSNRKNNNNNLNSLYEELEDESKENRHTGNQYNNDLEMIGSRKHRKLDLEDNHNMMLMNGDINGLISNNGTYNQIQSMTDQMKLNNVFNSQQMYQGTPHYFRQSAANSTTYMNNYSNRFYGGDHSTSFYNSGNSTTFYHPPTPAAYYSTSYRNHPQLDASYPRSTKFGDSETPKVNGYPNNLSFKSAGNLQMMYGNNYIPMSQSYSGYAAAAAAFINPAMIYPHMQPVYYPQQVFLSPHQLMGQNSMGDLYNHLGASSIGQHDFN